LGCYTSHESIYPYLLQQNKGHIVNIQASSGLVGIMHQSAYCTAKFAVRGFTETLRMELAGTGIGTTVVHPGGVNTNMFAFKGNQNITTPDVHQQSITRFAQKAITTPENAASRYLMLWNEKNKAGDWQRRPAIGPACPLFPVGYTNFVKKRIGKVFGNPYIKQ
jgi:butyryl-CoA dehydrogenase